jgi:hypothetical protein
MLRSTQLVEGGRALRLRYLLIAPAGAAVALLLWYAATVAWALVLRRVAQSVSALELDEADVAEGCGAETANTVNETYARARTMLERRRRSTPDRSGQGGPRTDRLRLIALFLEAGAVADLELIANVGTLL